MQNSIGINVKLQNELEEPRAADVCNVWKPVDMLVYNTGRPTCHGSLSGDIVQVTGIACEGTAGL